MGLEEHFGLDPDYSMTYRISAQEVVNLRDSAVWGTEHNLDVWQSVIDNSLATIGVLGPRQNLVGIGFLAGNARHAVLCDLVVHPNHRGRGIGQAIVRARMDIAERMHIAYLYTELAPTNTLRSLYEQLGFVATGNAYVRAARRHPSELE